MGAVLSLLSYSHASKGKDEKPIIVAAAMPAPGHTIPLAHIGGHLVRNGFKVYFISGIDFKDSIERAGMEYVEHPWKPMYGPRQFPYLPPHRMMQSAGLEDGSPSHSTAHRPNFFLDSTPVAFKVVTECLEDVRKKHPRRQVIILNEAMFMGLLPYYFGAPLPKGYNSMPRVINYHTTFNSMRSVDMDALTGLPISSTEEEREKVGTFGMGSYFNPEIMMQHASRVYKDLGATKEVTKAISDLMIDAYDVCLMPYSPSLDYPRSDLSPKIKFMGGLPIKPPNPNLTFPSWWPEIEANSALPVTDRARKKVVFVCQGTLMCDYNELAIPTIKALSRRDDVIVIAVLGIRNATLPDDLEIPFNTKVLDYFPYDVLLRRTDVFICNAGFGGFIQGIMHGVPMVMAGKGIDKGIVSERAARCGSAVNLYTRQPTVEALAEGIDKVLNNAKYKRCAEAMRKENESMDAMGVLEKVIIDFTERAT